MEKIRNPLKINPDSQFLKKTPFNLLQQKYELNKNYYNNEELEVHGFEPEMNEYLERRKKLLELIREKKNLNSFKNVNAIENKYKSIPSRAFSQMKNRGEEESMVREKFVRKQSLHSQMSNLEMQQIMKECET